MVDNPGEIPQGLLIEVTNLLLDNRQLEAGESHLPLSSKLVVVD